MNDHIFPYWDDDRLSQRDPGDEQPPHTPSKKSLDDRDNVELYIMSEEEEADFVKFLESDEYKNWQEQQAEIEQLSQSTEKRFYGLVKVKKADLIAPTESQLLSYYIDYGFNNIEDVIKEYGEEEMLREWYVNTNFTYDNEQYRELNSINHIDWDSEYEEVEVLNKDEYSDYKRYSW